MPFLMMQSTHGLQNNSKENVKHSLKLIWFLFLFFKFSFFSPLDNSGGQAQSTKSNAEKKYADTKNFEQRQSSIKEPQSVLPNEHHFPSLGEEAPTIVSQDSKESYINNHLHQHQLPEHVTTSELNCCWNLDCYWWQWTVQLRRF